MWNGTDVRARYAVRFTGLIRRTVRSRHDRGSSVTNSVSRTAFETISAAVTMADAP
jgi:hypothetical protein